MKTLQLRDETSHRLLRYSAAVGLGAFAFGQATTDALAEIVYTDLGGMVLERGDSVSFDMDGDGYNDFRLMNTSAGGIGDIGTVQLNTSIDPQWYGAPGTNPNFPNAGATYAQTLRDAIWLRNLYYVWSFTDNDVIGPSNPMCVDTIPTSGGRFYGLLSQYPGWDKNSFWCPVTEPWASNGSIPFPGRNYSVNDLPDNEYAGLRIVDGNGVERWAWVRFQVVLHDTGIEWNNFPGSDGYLTAIDYVYDTNRQVILYDMAIEMTPDSDVCYECDPCVEYDLDGDGFVGLADLDIILSNWNQTVPPGDPRADSSGDGYVGLSDLDSILECWNWGTPPTASIPEPGCLGLLAAGAGALAFRRRC